MQKLLSGYRLAFLLIVIVGLIIGSASYLMIGKRQLNGAYAAEEVFIKIDSGESLKEIAQKLESENIISSQLLFRVYAFLSGRAHALKPGGYLLNRSISLSNAIRILAGGPEEITITIVPGMTIKEIDDLLAASNIIKSGELINFNPTELADIYPWLNRFQKNGRINLEGLLLPDTYRFIMGSDTQSTVKKFFANFQSRALTFFSGSDNLVELLTLASILEKEIPDYQEKRIAAGLLKKRLAIKMPLQVDATIVYGKCQGRFLNCPPLTKIDYEKESVYNTYLYLGLPPTPISNPGLDSIRAATQPLGSEYWYYLSNPTTKKTIFSKTLNEHNDNRSRFLLR